MESEFSLAAVTRFVELVRCYTTCQISRIRWMLPCDISTPRWHYMSTELQPSLNYRAMDWLKHTSLQRENVRNVGCQAVNFHPHSVCIYIYIASQKVWCRILAITLPNLNRCSTSFAVKKTVKFADICRLMYHIMAIRKHVNIALFETQCMLFFSDI